MKPGIKTTEFWVTVLAFLAPLIFHFTGIDLSGTEETLAQAISGVISAVYVVGRLVVKHKNGSSAPLATANTVTVSSPPTGGFESLVTKSLAMIIEDLGALREPTTTPTPTPPSA